MATVAIDQMKDKLLSLDDVREALETTEPLSSMGISNADKIRFTIDPTWSLAADALGGDDVVAATITRNGVEHPLTKDGLLEAGVAFGIPATYAKKVPSNFLESQLNYWYSDQGIGTREFNLLVVGEDARAAAFTKPTIRPFSNRLLLNNIFDGIQNKYGGEVYADYKFNHTLQKTDIRLIVPEYTRTIENTGTDDDAWSAGIHLSNSLTGDTQTSVEGYLFRWWCTNGATTTLADVGSWSRRSDGQGEDVYDWARESVDAVLGGLEHSFQQVQSLADTKITGNANDVLRDVFSTYKVPVSQRQQIIDAMVEEENLTMYSVMQAITQLANDSTLAPARADALMRIGGTLPAAEHHRCDSCHRLT